MKTFEFWCKVIARREDFRLNFICYQSWPFCPLENEKVYKSTKCVMDKDYV